MVVKKIILSVILAVCVTVTLSATPKGKFAVILSGCGVYDGSEIQESVLTLLAIEKAGAEYQCFAPNILQKQVVNHLTGKVSAEKRNVLVESARIARGNVKPLSKLNTSEFDAIVLPGGLGVAKNLSTYAKDKSGMKVLPVLARLLLKAHREKKLLGFICISPVIAARVFGNWHVKLTIGTDASTASDIKKMNALHQVCLDTGFVYDAANKIYSTPGYMCGGSPLSISEGITKMISQMVNDL